MIAYWTAGTDRDVANGGGGFDGEMQARHYTPGARKPASLRLTFRDGIYAVDHVDTTETSILMELVRVCRWRGLERGAGTGPNAGLARAWRGAGAGLGPDQRPPNLSCPPSSLRLSFFYFLGGSQGQTMEKMLTLTQDQFAALLKRELTTPAPLDPSSDDASKAAVLGALPKREAYRYATVRPRSRRRRAGAARPFSPPRLTCPRIWWAVDAERRHCDAVAAGLPRRPAAAQDL